MELAVARTEIALSPAVRERMPEARLKTFLDVAHLIHISIQPRALAFSRSTDARESRPTRRFHRFSKM